MPRLSNWIPDINRWNLETPPSWWLQRLFDFDDKLVVIPSRQQMLYRIARRKQLSPGIGPLAVIDNQRDTAMLATHGLVPVTTMIRFASSWDIDAVLLKLRERDMWAVSGGPASGKSAQERAAKVADTIEAHEAAQDAKERTRLRDELDHRSRDAWRSYQARTGQRSRLTTSGPSVNGPTSRSTPQSAMTDGPRVVLASA
jgi:hypothetical protein